MLVDLKTNYDTQIKVLLLLLLLLLLIANGYVPGGSGTTIYNTQYNTILYAQKTQNNTYTLKIIHNTKITNTITQNYKHKVST
jgi:hypothetical protein